MQKRPHGPIEFAHKLSIENRSHVDTKLFGFIRAKNSTESLRKIKHKKNENAFENRSRYPSAARKISSRLISEIFPR